MANIKKKKGIIGILTGGGDVPGLNPAIRAVTIRAIHEGYDVIGIRRGWAGLIDIVRDKNAQNMECCLSLTEEIVNKVGRTGGPFFIPHGQGPAKSPMSMCRRTSGRNTRRSSMTSPKR